MTFSTLIWIGAAVLAVIFFLRLLRGNPDPSAAWRQLAAELNLRFEGNPGREPELRGRYRDAEVRLVLASYVGAKATLVQAALGGSPAGPPRGQPGSPAESPKSDPWDAADADPWALIRKQNSREIAELAEHPAVSSELRMLFSRNPGARVENDWVTIREPGVVRDGALLRERLSAVETVSRAFRRARMEPHRPSARAGDEAAATSAAGAAATATVAIGAGVPAAAAGADLVTGDRPAVDIPSAALPGGRRELSRTAAQFRRRTGLAFGLGVVPMIAGLSAAVSGALRLHVHFLGLQGVTWLVAGSALFGVGLWVFVASYRCPSCNRFLRSPKGGGLLIDPKACPHCLAPFR